MNQKPIFPYDYKRAAALAKHFDCPVAQINIVEGEGLDVYTWVEEGMSQEQAEAENGRWSIAPHEEFEPNTKKHVADSLRTYFDHVLVNAAVGVLPDTFLLLMRRAVQCYIGKSHIPLPSIRVALEPLLGAKKLKNLKQGCEDAVKIVHLAGLPEEATDLVELALSPKPNSQELNDALLKVVDVDKVIEQHFDDDGWEGIWSCTEHDEQEFEGVNYHLLRHQ